MDDKTLRRHFVDELEFDPRIDAAHIGGGWRGDTLSGHVPT
jgi:hypothetical protein